MAVRAAGIPRIDLEGTKITCCLEGVQTPSRCSAAWLNHFSREAPGRRCFFLRKELRDAAVPQKEGEQLLRVPRVSLIAWCVHSTVL